MNNKTYKVLIVEDDPMVAMINEQYVCKNNNFSVVAKCKNGQDALDFLKENKVDLIVLDIFMPYMDGIETLKKIRESKIDSDVIMVTAANDTSTLEETMYLGVLDFLIKPFAYERFQIALEKFLNKKKMLNENSILNQAFVDKIISSKGISENSIIDIIPFQKNPTTNERSLEILDKLNIKNLPKGIQEKTLLLIIKHFEKNSAWQTVEDISEDIGISIVTARHYLTFLEEKKFIRADINYRTGGRPSMLYKR